MIKNEMIKNQMIKNKRSAFGSADEVRDFESGILFKRNSFLLLSCFFQIKEARDLRDWASAFNHDQTIDGKYSLIPQ